MRRDGPSLVPSRRAERQRRGFAVLAFGLSCLCVMVVNLSRWDEGGLASASAWVASLQFTAILMGTLLAHELGHLLAARWLGMRLGLPWFLPFPFFVGTMGAIIVPEEAPRDRRRLALMAVAGPVAGACVLVALMLVLLPGRSSAQVGGVELALPPLWWGLAYLWGDGSSASANDPVELALWVGCLVTWINLMPFGQLDGGHVWSACFPRYAQHATWAVTLVFLALSWWWMGWLLWVVLLHVVGQRRPTDVRRPDIPVGRSGQLAGGIALVVLLAFAVPFPI